MIGYIYFLQIEDDIFKIVNELKNTGLILFLIKVKVANPKDKIKVFQNLLIDKKYGDVYRVSIEILENLIDLMNPREVKKINCRINRPNRMKPDDMRILFKDGRLLRCKEEIGYYDEETNSIYYDGIKYKSLSAFAKVVYGKIVNGWDVCEYEGDDGWIKTKKLKN